jgi:hypothetical protein
MARKFPQEIFLHVDDESQPEEDQWFSVDEKPDAFAETKRKIVAGRYRLLETVVVSAKTSVSVRKRRK